MNKREAVLSLLDSTKEQTYIPAGFFLHFPPEYHEGQAAVDKHIEFFRYTGMDIVKIQYESNYPKIESIKKPEDWANMPCYGLDFYEGQLKAVEGLVKELKDEAVIVHTLYSPYMLAGYTVTDDLLVEHLKQDPDAVKKGMEIITESLQAFIHECIKLGVDGFYTSTQGGEAGRFEDPTIFDDAVMPYDLVLMNEINEKCDFNILHVCDYMRSYDDFTRFLNYPGDIVNCPLHIGDEDITMQAAADMFKRPFMGGLERLATLATGTPDEVKAVTKEVLENAPTPFFLGADCTVPANTPWDNLKAAIDTAHEWKK